MNLKSIRWRLPLSYIAIALVAAVASGAMMLTVLRSYYLQAERDYLSRNASSIALAVQQMINAGVPDFVLADQAVTLSFLLQARVQVYAQDGSLLADSGTPDTQRVMMVSNSTGSSPQVEVSIPAGTTPSMENTPFGGPDSLSGIFLLPQPPTGISDQVVVVNDCSSGPGCAAGVIAGTILTGTASFTQPVGIVMPLANSFYGFEFNGEPDVNLSHRSTQQVEQNLKDGNGQIVGRVVVSEGPAYGSEILASVARAWLAASLIALVVAGGAGWMVSRRITAPVLQLTDVTSHMAQGDLSARSGATSDDEFGMLGRSFDQMADQIEELVSTLRRFVADAAHELNTPITALLTDIELARTSQDEAERDRLMDRQSQQVERLHSLVSSLLDLSRLESKVGQGLHEAVNLSQLVETMSELYASRAEQSGISFEFETANENVIVNGDAAQLRIAIENLLDNALKFTPAEGTVRLTLKQEASQVVIEVRDTGIGIPEEDLPLLFKRFHRGRNAAAYPGNGLGLAIVDQIARLHGGIVTVENTSPGVLFTLTINSKAM